MIEDAANRSPLSEVKRRPTQQELLLEELEKEKQQKDKEKEAAAEE